MLRSGREALAVLEKAQAEAAAPQAAVPHHRDAAFVDAHEPGDVPQQAQHSGGDLANPLPSPGFERRRLPAPRCFGRKKKEKKSAKIPDKSIGSGICRWPPLAIDKT